MAIDWLTVRQAPIEAIQHGVDATDLFETVMTGPRTFDRIDYPAAQVYPVNTTRTSGNEFLHNIEVNVVVERSRGYDYIEEVLHPMAGVITECMDALAATECVVTYVPSEIEDFAGELDNTGVVVIRINFEITTQVDLAET